MTSYIEKKMGESSWHDSRVVLRYKSEEEKGRLCACRVVLRWWKECLLCVISLVDGWMDGAAPPSLPPPPNTHTSSHTNRSTGLFARAPLRKGELVLVFCGKVAFLLPFGFHPLLKRHTIQFSRTHSHINTYTNHARWCPFRTCWRRGNGPWSCPCR